MARAGDGRCVLAAQGTGSAMLFVEGGGPGHGTVVTGVAAPGGAGAAVAGARGAGCVWAARGTGSAVVFMGGRGRGHGIMVACVAALGGLRAAGAGPCGVVAAPRGAGAVRMSDKGVVVLWGA